jgi:hypothetical protein
VDFQDEEGLGGGNTVDVVHALVDEVSEVLGVAAVGRRPSAVGRRPSAWRIAMMRRSVSSRG